MSERFLVTGAAGCIGAWVVAELVAGGASVVALDLADDLHRLSLLLDAAQLAALPRVQADVSDLGALEQAIDRHGVTHVIHLAALQVPFCRADPPLGARVNVVGTVNVLEAVRRRAERMSHPVYASSVAALDEIEHGGAPSGNGGHPGTIYGVYKRANEGSAHAYFRDSGLPSVGLRPHTVFGPGRDQGLTSAPTQAALAAVAGRPYHIPFGGGCQLQYAPDVARSFIAAARARPTGAEVHNLAGPVVDVADIVAALEAVLPPAAGLVTHGDAPLPFPEQADAASLERLVGALPSTPLSDAVADTVRRFEALLADGRLQAPVEAVV